MRRSVLLLAALALVASGCGGGEDDESSNEQVLVAAISQQGAANPDNPLDRATTTCLAEGVVSEFGVDELAELGVNSDNPNLDLGRVFVTRQQAERAFDMAFDCLEFDQEMLEFLPEGLEIAEQSISCLAGGLNSDTFRDLFVSVVLDNDGDARVIDSPAGRLSIGLLLAECLNADELSQVTQLGG